MLWGESRVNSHRRCCEEESGVQSAPGRAFSMADPAYNLGGILWLDGELNPQALEQTMNYVVARQAILRVEFSERDGQGWQRIASHVDRVLQVEDVSNEADPEAAAYRLGREHNAKPFDLETESLLRYRLVRLSEQRHVLLISLHHIVGDAWSLGVFMQEFLFAYSTLRDGLTPNLPRSEEHTSELQSPT